MSMMSSLSVPWIVSELVGHALDEPTRSATGLEHVEFVWYVKRIAPWALAGYFAGAVVVTQQAI